jgi:hypothetical protein
MWNKLLIISGIHCCGSGPDPYQFSGSGSISYSSEHNRINWKGKFNKNTFCEGPVGPTDKENQERCMKSNILGILSVGNGKDPDPHKTVRSGSVSNRKVGSGYVLKSKAGSGSVSKGSGSATLIHSIWYLKVCHDNTGCQGPSSQFHMFLVEGIQDCSVCSLAASCHEGEGHGNDPPTEPPLCAKSYILS